MKSAILFLACALLAWNGVASSPIFLYEHRNHQGIMWHVDPYGNDCVNLATGDAASSANTNNECFVIFEHNNCIGSSMRLAPGVGCHSNFADCGFNDIVSSVRRC